MVRRWMMLSDGIKYYAISFFNLIMFEIELCAKAIQTSIAFSFTLFKYRIELLFVKTNNSVKNIGDLYDKSAKD